jgi:hypothetical protein
VLETSHHAAAIASVLRDSGEAPVVLKQEG